MSSRGAGEDRCEHKTLRLRVKWCCSGPDLALDLDRLCASLAWQPAQKFMVKEEVVINAGQKGPLGALV